MARVKYADGQSIISASIDGFTITPNWYGQTMRKKASQRHNFSALQKERAALLLKCSRAWSGQSQGTRDNWQAWTEYLPQPTKRDNSISIAAYQNFTKRNFFKLLAYGAETPYILNPSLVTYASDSVAITSSLTTNSLSLKITFTRSANDLDCYFFLTFTPFESREIRSYFDRYMLYTRNVSGTFDITQAYLKRFGKLPLSSFFLHVFYFSAGKDNGQFFNRVMQKIPVTLAQPTKDIQLNFTQYDQCVSIICTSYATTVAAIIKQSQGNVPGCGFNTSSGSVYMYFTIGIGSQLYYWQSSNKVSETAWRFELYPFGSNHYRIFHFTVGVIDYIENYDT